MSASVSALIVAFLGIAGTVTSGFLAQWGAGRTKARELAHSDNQTRAERAYQERRTLLDARRSCYADLNTAARLYQTALTDFFHALNCGSVSPEIQEALEEARLAHRARHSEAQMLVPDNVLGVASAVNKHLGEFYGLLKRLQADMPEGSDSLARAEEYRRNSWDLIAGMRSEMRRDLGVGGASSCS